VCGDYTGVVSYISGKRSDSGWLLRFVPDLSIACREGKLAPRARRLRAVSAPMPLEAPITHTRWPRQFLILLFMTLAEG